MSLNCTQGFILNDIKARRIKSEDAKRYGISDADFSKVDTDKNEVIDGSEFIKRGMDSLKLFQAFKGISGDNYNEKFGNNTFKDKKEALSFGKSENSEQIKNFLKPQGISKTQNSQPVKRTVNKPVQKTGRKAKPEPFKELGKSLFDFIKNSEYSLSHPNISGNGQVAKKFDFLA